VQSLLEAVYCRYGFDFRDYAYPSIRRRIDNVVRAERLASISELEQKLMDERACMERFLLAITVNVTSMFRDPDFYRSLRSRVAPLVKSLPFVRVWHAGCSTGEEVYSMAILLREEGLYDRCRIYATDMNEAVVAKARSGIYPLAYLRTYTGNYLAAGGRNAFSEYYTAMYGNVIFDERLKRNIVFAQHNLVTDASFNEFHLIVCRNVLIYFNERLSRRVHDLIYGSLAPMGFLALGSRETIQFTPRGDCYETIDASERIYRRVI
jgi:chemotaxis protein methyltransferase CheR